MNPSVRLIYGENFKKRANVFWRTNVFCNYNCSYCWPYSHTKKKDFVDRDVALNGIDRIKGQFSSKGFDEIHWGWAGGEVTFHPNFLEFVSKIGESKGQFMNLTTNLSQNIRWWEKFLLLSEDFEHIRVSASLHLEFADINKFKDKLKFLSESGLDVVIKQVMVPQKFEETKHQLSFFEDLNIPIQMKCEKQNDRIVHGYTEQQKKEMEESSEFERFFADDTLFPNIDILNINDKNNFKGWTCNAGHQSIAIFNDKVVRGVFACNKEVLGHLNDFELTEPKPCITDLRCTCSADLKIPKYRD